MTSTLLVLALAGIGALTAFQGLRSRLAHRPSHSHQRVLTTLDGLTRHPSDQPARGRVEGARQHVRVVAADPADRRRARVTGRPGATPVRRSGSAPFRAPVAVPDEAAPRPAVAAPLPLTASTGRDVPVRIDAVPGDGATAAPGDAVPAAVAEGAAAGAVAGLVDAMAASPARRALAATRRAAPSAASLRSVRPLRRATPQARGRHGSRSGIAAAAVAAVAVVAVLAATLGGSPHPTGAHAAAPLPHATAPIATPPAPATTAAPPVALASTGPGGSVYTLNGPVTIAITAAAPSWLQVRTAGPTGPLVWQGVLAAGQNETVPGPAWVRLGNPTGVTVVVNGTPVQAPSVVSGQPTNLQFG